MDLTFVQENDWFVSQFEATGDFNLHVEKSEGAIYLYQRTSSVGEFDFIKNFGWNRDGDNIIDMDFSGVVYPKTIKIKCKVEPTIAVVTFNS